MKNMIVYIVITHKMYRQIAAVEVGFKEVLKEKGGAQPQD